MAKAARRSPKAKRTKETAQERDASVLSAERYALVAEAVTEGIYDWNVANDILYLSMRLYTILGLAPGSLGAADWIEHVHPDDIPSYRAAVSCHFKGETERVDCEYRMRRGSGDFIWVADRGVCMRDEDGRAVRLVGAIREITARKLAEAKLSAAREEAERAGQRLQDAIESISEGIVLFDDDNRIIICNSNYRHYFTGVAGETVGQMVKPGAVLWDIMRAAHKVGMFPMIKDENLEAYIEKRKEMRRNPGEMEPVEQLLSDGRWLQINEHRSATGGTASVYTDITELKKREADLATKTAMLESVSSQLSKYLSPQVYASIFSGKQSVEVASKRKKLTIFFSDIAGFTDTVDTLESEELTVLLNQYLTEMSRIALAHGATVDKFIGDAILAFFGDPETHGAGEDATRCVRMAIDMQARMRELQFEWRERGLEQAFELRIGITTGYCTVGNFGSEDRMDYTVIGNPVNLAARLQGYAETGTILLDQETFSLTKETILAKDRGTISVRGFSRPIQVYGVEGTQGELAEGPRMITCDDAGFHLTIDRSKLSKSATNKAIKALEKAAKQLKD